MTTHFKSIVYCINLKITSFTYTNKKMKTTSKRLRRASIAATFFLIGQLPITAYATSGQVSLTPSLLNFNYVEYDETGKQIDKEYGTLPGIELAIKNTNEYGVYLEAGISVHRARLNYEGGIIGTDIPHQTQTDEELTHFHLTVGNTFGDQDKPLDVYLYLSKERWDRKIQPSYNAAAGGYVAGYYEKYQWSKVGIGIKQTLPTQGANQVFFGVKLFRINSPSMTAYLDFAGLGSPTFSLHEKTGFRTILGWRTRHRAQFDYGITAVYEQYKFGASAVNTANGLREPDSKTKRLGLQLDILIPF